MREYPEPRLSALTSLRLGGKALALLMLEDEDDYAILPQRVKFWGGATFYLGRGTNLLARDGELPLVLVQSANEKIEIIGADQGKILVRAGAGAKLSDMLNFCLKHELSGLEGLAGIPGSMGGAAAMNAGSFGIEFADCLYALAVFEKQGKRQYLRNEIGVEYRKLTWGGNNAGLVQEAIFALTPSRKNVIFKKIRHNFFEKKSRQPLEAWSAGCAFKNPSGQSAGRLLDESGLKGKSLGGMAFSEKHANFLINTGRGTAKAAFELLELAREKVFIRHGIRLDLEVRIVK